MEILKGASTRSEPAAARADDAAGRPVSADVHSAAPASVLEKFRRFMAVLPAGFALPSSFAAPMEERNSAPYRWRGVQASLRNCGPPYNWFLAVSAESAISLYGLTQYVM